MLGEDFELLEAIISNDDTLTYGNIVSVYAGAEETVTALTDDGIGELTDMIRDAQITTKTGMNSLMSSPMTPNLSPASRLNHRGSNPAVTLLRDLRCKHLHQVPNFRFRQQSAAPPLPNAHFGQNNVFGRS